MITTIIILSVLLIISIFININLLNSIPHDILSYKILFIVIMSLIRF